MGRERYSGNGNRRGNGNGNGGSRGGRGRGGGGGHSSRGGQGGNRGGGGRGRGGNSRGGGRRFGGRHNMNSGNKRERIQVESGFLVLIDQFMLANPQFLERVEATMNESPEVKNQIIEEFGGVVVQLEPALYRIERNPFHTTIVVHQEGELPEADTLPSIASEESGKVFVDTRCLAMIDRELLDDADLLNKYKDLWFAGEDKACRDLLRDNGGAVRYGFQRFGDELLVFSSTEGNLVALWPSRQAGSAVAEEAA